MIITDSGRPAYKFMDLRVSVSGGNITVKDATGKIIRIENSKGKTIEEIK